LDAWPVGSVFIGVVATSPVTLLGGGTWARIAEGRVLVSQSSDTDFDTAQETGGEKTVTLTAAQSGVPAHAHIQRANTSTSGSSGAGHARDTSTSGGPSNNWFTTADNAAADAAQAHNNMPPYFVVYMWERTA
jgi:microcystin-dependent protein